MSQLGLGLGLPSSYNLNSVFDFNALDPYYYFDPSSLSAGSVHTWHGRVVGSDNDANLTITQTTSADQPTSAGMVVTFNDNTDHLDVPAGFVEPADGSWQVVGTSLGTFSYKVNANAVPELNLLGNLGSAAHRQSGDLYGIILLPSSATGQDIQESRKLLIDRGASDGASGINFYAAWYLRDDIVQFKAIDFSSVSNAQSAWNGCSSLTSFSSDLPSVTNAPNAWQNCTSLTSFSSDLSSVTNAQFAWNNCTSLTSFSSDLSSVTNAHSAWKSCSSLTSFSSDLPLVTNASYAWYVCSSLTSFSSDLSSVTNASNAWNGCTSLTSFSSDLPSATNAGSAWKSCSSLTSFSSDLPAVTSATSAWFGCSSLTSFSSDLSSVTNASGAWRDCTSLTSFSSDLPSAINVSATWRGCNSLTSFSSNMPLVSSASYAWFVCSSLTSFSSALPSVTNMFVAWLGCSSLTDFSADVFANWNPPSISSGVFNRAWESCTSLTAQSVENILTSIDSSGKYATSTGASGGSALADAGIDIDYDGTTLSAATNTAVTSLKSKGWSIIVNNVTL